MSRDILLIVKQTVQVTREDGTSERFVLEEERDNGALLLMPDTSVEAIMRRSGSRPMTDEKFAEHFDDLPTGPA